MRFQGLLWRRAVRGRAGGRVSRWAGYAIGVGMLFTAIAVLGQAVEVVPLALVGVVIVVAIFGWLLRSLR